MVASQRRISCEPCRKDVSLISHAMQCMAQPQTHSLAIQHLAFSSLALLLLIYPSTNLTSQYSIHLTCFQLLEPKSFRDTILRAAFAQMSELARIQGSIIATWVLAVIIVCLRFFARRISNAGLWYDDWLIVPATVRISRQ